MLIKEFLIALGYQIKAISFIIKHKLYYYFLTPIIVFILLFIALTNFSSSLAQYVRSLVEEYLWEFSLFSLEILVKVLIYVVSISFFGYLILIIMSPVLSFLSEKTEKIIKGKEYAFDFSQFLNDVFRGIFLAIRNALYEFLILILMFMLSFIPFLVFITPIFLFLISCYFYGFSFLDYVLERERYTVRESIKYARKHKGLVIGSGLVFKSLLMIPFLGQLIAVFYILIATVSSTMAYLEVKNDK